jgi:putative addiction module component (TIGR02574 family)
MALSEEERFELVEALLTSQGASDESTLDPAWLVEIQKRSAEIDSGEVQPAPWNVVRDRVRKRLEGHSND